MKPTDPPWAGTDEWRMLFQLAAFAKDQSGADGVIAVFLKGQKARLGWFLPPELYPSIPMILDNASRESLKDLEWVIGDPGVQLPTEVRKEIGELLKQWQRLKPN